ncbi:MAG: isoprenylcysteine carboxylmethyltransferase family protein [Acidobacteriia bacterium]|nr:isoprenylcysteine carboxylmethyltransferase family protein [Terriglobia bacterium]
MTPIAWLMASWLAWGFPFVFLAPHGQKRPSVTAAGKTRAGLLLECAAIFIAWAFRTAQPGIGRTAASMLLGPVAAALGWTAVRHLGKQFRIHAGLYHDHELVRTGPYALVRHPIYSSLLAILLSTLLLWTPWPWVALSLALFLAGTEIRVRTEDALLLSRFGEDFTAYRRRVPAYIPFIR